MNYQSETPAIPQPIRKKIWLELKRAHKDKRIGSITTVSAYTSSLVMFTSFLLENDFLINGVDETKSSFNTLLKFADRELVIDYLKDKMRKEYSLQSIQLDIQALNFWFNGRQCPKYIKNLDELDKPNHKLGESLSLSNLFKTVAKLDESSLVKYLDHNNTKHFSKTYTKNQIEIIMRHVTPRNAFAIKLCWLTGIRVHELLNLRRLDECKPSFRELKGIKEIAEKFKFTGLSGSLYTVKGKGGLIRIVMIPTEIIDELESFRLPNEYIKKDRSVKYPSLYNIGGGNALSKSFARASKCWLGWSTGIHSLRHDHAKKRLKTVFNLTGDYDLARAVISQELGHFRLAVTDVYLY